MLRQIKLGRKELVTILPVLLTKIYQRRALKTDYRLHYTRGIYFHGLAYRPHNPA